MKLITKPTSEQVAARRAAYRLVLETALAELAAAHAEYPDLEAAMVERILRTHGLGYLPYGITRLAGMLRNIGRVRARGALTQEKAERVRLELFGPG